MIQEIVVGLESNIERLQVYVDTKENILSRFFHDNVRQHPPNFGVMRIGVSTPRSEEVGEMAQRLLAKGNCGG
ncbi:MAG: hypothetical protein AAGC68_03990 [Verrucomicrobiota bacterium]